MGDAAVRGLHSLRACRRRPGLGLPVHRRRQGGVGLGQHGQTAPDAAAGVLRPPGRARAEDGEALASSESVRHSWRLKLLPYFFFFYVYLQH